MTTILNIDGECRANLSEERLRTGHKPLEHPPPPIDIVPGPVAPAPVRGAEGKLSKVAAASVGNSGPTGVRAHWGRRMSRCSASRCACLPLRDNRENSKNASTPSPSTPTGWKAGRSMAR